MILNEKLNSACDIIEAAVINGAAVYIENPDGTGILLKSGCKFTTFELFERLDNCSWKMNDLSK